MRKEDGTTNLVQEIVQDLNTEFCDKGIETMCRFYGVKKHHFEQMLEAGFTQIKFGRGPFGFADENGYYIVAFAAFSKEDSPTIETFEVRKIKDTFGNASLGLSTGEYSPEEIQEIANQFELILIEQNLEDFINRFNWDQK